MCRRREAASPYRGGSQLLTEPPRLQAAVDAPVEFPLVFKGIKLSFQEK